MAEDIPVKNKCIYFFGKTYNVNKTCLVKPVKSAIWWVMEPHSKLTRFVLAWIGQSIQQNLQLFIDFFLTMGKSHENLLGFRLTCSFCKLELVIEIQHMLFTL
jgi:hypothetical protein